MEINKYIIITTINEPTEAVIKFAALANYKLVVVGDKKTNSNWSYPNVTYLGVDDAFESAFAHILPYNHYCRKILGYVYAVQQGATEIIDTDDDNIPYDNWQFPDEQEQRLLNNAQHTFVNIYELFADKKIWPRGLPLPLINKKTIDSATLQNGATNVGVWQGLADEDPDVDAIYRLTDDTPCYFKKEKPVVLASGVVCPFNSQNTWFTKELFPLLYLPVTVTFRFTDILRGIIAQPIMWCAGYQLGFTEATVIQKRNPHNYFKDFESEITMFTQVEKAYELALKHSNSDKSVKENLKQVYEALAQEQIVTSKELEVLNAWLSYF